MRTFVRDTGRKWHLLESMAGMAQVWLTAVACLPIVSGVRALSSKSQLATSLAVQGCCVGVAEVSAAQLAVYS